MDDAYAQAVLNIVPQSNWVSCGYEPYTGDPKLLPNRISANATGPDRGRRAALEPAYAPLWSSPRRSTVGMGLIPGFDGYLHSESLCAAHMFSRTVWKPVRYSDVHVRAMTCRPTHQEGLRTRRLVQCPDLNQPRDSKGVDAVSRVDQVFSWIHTAGVRYQLSARSSCRQITCVS